MKEGDTGWKMGGIKAVGVRMGAWAWPCTPDLTMRIGFAILCRKRRSCWGFHVILAMSLHELVKYPIVRFGKRMLVPKAAFDKMLGVSPENEAEK